MLLFRKVMIFIFFVFKNFMGFFKIFVNIYLVVDILKGKMLKM